MTNQVFPGMIGTAAAADLERNNFDRRNEQLLESGRRPDILFIGDSITQYWDTALFFGGKHRLIVNRGIGGDIPEHILRRFDADCIQLHPGFCICMAGINMAHDLLGMERSKEKVGNVTDRMVHFLGDMVEKADKAGIPMALGSLLPSNCPEDPCEGARNVMVPEANRKIKALCVERKIPYIDYYDAVLDVNQRDMIPSCTRDGIHPSPEGYVRMKKVLVRTLPEVFLGDVLAKHVTGGTL